VTIKAGSLVPESIGALTLQGATSLLKSTNSLTATAPKIAIESSGQIDVKVSAALNLRGCTIMASNAAVAGVFSLEGRQM
jgi:hypothetical protein